MKGKCRIRGPSKNQTWTNSWILVSVNQFWWGIEPPYSSLHYFLQAGETNFGTPEKYVEPRGLWILRGWVGWSDSKKLVQRQNWFSVQSFLWGNFMWQKQDQMVKLFPGKFWESIINVSLKEDNPNKQVFQLGPLLMQRG